MPTGAGPRRGRSGHRAHQRFAQRRGAGLRQRPCLQLAQFGAGPRRGLQPAACQLLAKALAAHFQRACQAGVQRRQRGVAGIETFRAMQQFRRLQQLAARQHSSCRLQQVFQRILAPFQRRLAARLRLQHLLVERQRGGWPIVQMARGLRGARARQQLFDADGLGLHRLQPGFQRIHARPRRLQLPRQPQRGVRPRRIARRDGGLGARQRCLGHPRQPVAGLRLVRLQRQRRLEQFACAAIGPREPAGLQRDFRTLAQCVVARIRPQPAAQRVAKRDPARQAQQQERGAGQCGDPHRPRQRQPARPHRCASRRHGSESLHARRADSTPGSDSSRASSRPSCS